MKLDRLIVTNFKNYAEADIALCGNVNCFVGNNGAGKTNLLDAVYYLSFCKSYFNPVDMQNIRIGEDFFAVHGHYGDDVARCVVRRGQGKELRWNKKPYKTLAEHIGKLPLVMVSPADQILVMGGSEERRRFIDMVICQYDPAYTESLLRYNKALLQRNTMLKQEQEPDPEVLLLWEEQMAHEGAYIYEKRDEYITELIPVFQQFYNQISQEHEQAELRYVSHLQRGPLLEQLTENRFKDRAVGYSLHGIHKDDLEMLQGGYPENLV